MRELYMTVYQNLIFEPYIRHLSSTWTDTELHTWQSILTLSNNLAVVLGLVHSTSCFLHKSSKKFLDSEIIKVQICCSNSYFSKTSSLILIFMKQQIWTQEININYLCWYITHKISIINSFGCLLSTFAHK